MTKRLFPGMLGAHAVFIRYFLLGYALLALFYWFALWYTSAFTFNSWDQTLLNYGLKMGFTIPVYYLLFVQWKKWTFQRRLWMHLWLCPLYLLVWRYSFYFLCDVFKIGRLQGTGSFWDIYIGVLIYLIQFFLLHLHELYVQFLAKQKSEKMLLEAGYKSEMNALKAQIQPHFLFNTLNSINASLPPHLETTREQIAQLADVFRYSLRMTEQDYTTVAAEVNFLTNCLQLEKARFADRLQFSVGYDAAVQQAQLPAMLVQPLVENAVKHGIGTQVQGGKVTVYFADAGTNVQVSIADTGPGFGAEANDQDGHGIGMRNVQLRLEKMYGSRLEVHSAQGHTEVSFLIPKIV